ncbi:MAG: hypothetical protein J5989_08475 [Alistipes sp.]|nr:hypothetical protein [Alistipes sp.]MBR2169327.1 hypothetical protein [Alistipes sp.]MBR6671437.1 hypothetical protein [Alistipes sp.]MBR7097612.1 hypothetical protein [Alistipes sp.]
MSNIIVNPKNYTGHELDTIFFRPLLSGPSAESLGIRILYNMPMPTVVQMWDHSGNVLSPFDEASAWSGGTKTTHYQKTIPMSRVKAENAFSASDYFSTIFELITNRSDVNMEDLTGTELEVAETELFRRAIAESIRMNLWLGDKSGELETGYTSFDGLLKIINERVKNDDFYYAKGDLDSQLSSYTVQEIFDLMIRKASPRLKGLYNEGEVAFFVSPIIYSLYESFLDNNFGTAAYTDTQTGRRTLMYHGFPVIEINLDPAISSSKLSQNFCFFTDRRNLVMAVNTADSPGSEVRMWYNPDQMENRQRAVFAIGCEILDDELVCAYTNVTE